MLLLYVLTSHIAVSCIFFIFWWVSPCIYLNCCMLLSYSPKYPVLTVFALQVLAAGACHLQTEVPFM